MALKVRSLAAGALCDVIELVPHRFEDARGYFSEVYNRDTLRNQGIDLEFIQDNQSLSRDLGTVRGLHFQSPPFAQAKLVRVLQGAILDVAVDIRKGSPGYGQYVACELTAEQGNQLLIPEGFAHGFCTLCPDTVVFYKVSAPYSREHDHGLLWNDPALAIDWPVSEADAILSDKDRVQPRLAELESPFVY